jgi:nitroreductase
VRDHGHGSGRRGTGMSGLLDLDPDKLLTTTRAVRRRLDFERPVPLEVIRECLEVAVQAPSGSNAQGWHWVVVADEAKRAALGEIYARAFALYRASPQYAGRVITGDPAREATQQRVAASAEYLAENMGRVPVLVIPCISGRVDGAPALGSASVWGSLLPATWSFCLAARARGLGTSWTTLHLMFEREAADVLGIPFDEVAQGALLPVAYTKGTDFRPAPRVPLDGIVHVDGW